MSMKIDPIKLLKKIPVPLLRNRLMDFTLSIVVPFQRGLNFKILEFSDQKMRVLSPNKRARKNHVGGAHACALALIGEYCAGILVAQHYELDTYRMIIGHLEIEYFKQGFGDLTGEALAPEEWPVVTDGEAWIPMQTRITNEKGEEVAICKTKWQVKRWDQVRKKNV